MKFRYLLILLLLSLFCFHPISVDAKEFQLQDSSFISSSFYILDDDVDIGFNEDDYNKEFENCNSILGDPNDEDSVAWLIQEALNIIRVVGPLLILVLSSFDFIKVILNGDEKAMKDAQRKLITRLILAGLLFAVPSIVGWLLDFFHITNSTCGIQ